MKFLPIEDPVLLMAYIAYSICWSLPSGVKVVVFESYFRDILKIIQIINLILLNIWESLAINFI